MQISRYLYILFIITHLQVCKSPDLENDCDIYARSPKDNLVSRILDTQSQISDKTLLKLLFPNDYYLCRIQNQSITDGIASPSFSSFSFTSGENELSQNYTATINQNVISISVPYGKVSQLIPTFTTDASSIKVGNTTVVSGITSLDFSTSLTFVLTGKTGLTQTYTVSTYLLTPVADTNQSTCYSGNTLSTCAATSGSHPNQDGHFVDSPNAKGVLTSSTNANYPNDPINKDTLKGIVWKTCEEGMTGTTCTGGTLQQVTHATATTLCNQLNSSNSGAGYAGLKKWRLPTWHELNQLQDHNVSNVFWNTSIFPNANNTIAANYYRWTSSLILPASTSAMAINELQLGQSVGNSNPVRCVNGDSPPTPDLVDNGDGTILDKRTKLIWQKCSFGQTNDTSCTGSLTTASWTNALLNCQSLNLASRSWRLPNLSELVTLMDMSKSTPFFDTTLFPNLTTANFHSSTTQMAGVSYDNILTIGSPIVGGISGKTNPENVKCIAGP